MPKDQTDQTAEQAEKPSPFDAWGTLPISLDAVWACDPTRPLPADEQGRRPFARMYMSFADTTVTVTSGGKEIGKIVGMIGGGLAVRIWDGREVLLRASTVWEAVCAALGVNPNGPDAGPVKAQPAPMPQMTAAEVASLEIVMSALPAAHITGPDGVWGDINAVGLYLDSVRRWRKQQAAEVAA